MTIIDVSYRSLFKTKQFHALYCKVEQLKKTLNNKADRAVYFAGLLLHDVEQTLLKFSFVRETLQAPPPFNVDPNRMKELIQDAIVKEKEKKEVKKRIDELLGKIPVRNFSEEKKTFISEGLWKKVRSSDAQKQFWSDYDKWLAQDGLSAISNEVPTMNFFKTAVEERIGEEFEEGKVGALQSVDKVSQSSNQETRKE